VVQKFIKSLTKEFIKWSPSGASAGVTIHAFLQHEWTQSVILSFVTACTTIWVKFSTGFMEEAEKEAEQRGGSLAHWVFTMLDMLMDKLGKEATQLWCELTSDFRGQYLSSICDACSDLKIEGFKIGFPVLDLEDIFIPLKVATGIPRQISRAIVQSISNEEAQEIWNFLSQSRKTPAYRRIAILAPPGYGKTTLLKHLVLTYARKAHRKHNVPDLIPVLISLRLQTVQEQLTREKPPTLAELITEQVMHSDDPPLNPPPKWFENQLKAGHCLVMLDGLDEVANADERQQVSQWVNQQIKRYRQTQTTFLLTSRPHGYQSNILEDVGLVLEVKPFTLEQVKQFIHSWYLRTEIYSQGRDDADVRELAQENASNLIDAIIRKPAIRQMSSNPLLVTMIATVHYSKKALPRQRVGLYQEICDVLLGERQNDKGIKTPLEKEQNKSLLQELALQLMLRETRSFTEEDGKALIQDQLKAVSDTLSPEMFLSQIKDVSGLLVEKQVGTYEFAHLNLQEYLAAAQIEKLQQEAILTTNFQNPWWAETIRLYAAQADATNLIQVALHDQNVYSLSLAYDCLEESSQADPTVSKALEDLLEAGLESDDSALAQMAAEVKLSRRLSNLLIVDESTAIDRSYITRAEYRLVFPDIPLSNTKSPITNLDFPAVMKFCNWLRANTPKLQRSQDSSEEQLYHYRQLTPKEEELYPVKETSNQVQGLRIARVRLSEPLLALQTQIERESAFSRYEYLFHCLMNGQWKEADKATNRVMCQVADCVQESWLRVEDIKKFPCEDLRTINQLWVQFSGGRFGFSVQRDIYASKEVGGKLDGKYDEEAFIKFSDRVKWREDGKWILLNNLTYDLTGVPGHLPLCSGFGGGGGGRRAFVSLLSHSALQPVTSNPPNPL